MLSEISQTEKEKYCYQLYADIYHLEKAMAPQSSTLAWRIPWTVEPGRLQSMGSQRIVRD